MKDLLIYKATYRMENIFAEGYIILSEYVEGIFARDYMAIYHNSDSTCMSLQTLSFETPLFPLNLLVHSYISYQFSMIGDLLYPGQIHAFFSNKCDLYLNISADIVEGDQVNDILKQLYELRSIFQS